MLWKLQVGRCKECWICEKKKRMCKAARGSAPWELQVGRVGRSCGHCKWEDDTTFYFLDIIYTELIYKMNMDEIMVVYQADIHFSFGCVKQCHFNL